MANLSDHLVNYQSNDTLDSVTSRGANTTNDLTIGSLLFSTGASLTSSGVDSSLQSVAGNTGSLGLYGGPDYNSGSGIAVYGASHSNQADKIRFFTSGFTERMVMDSSGNLGIGTTDPSEKLDIQAGNIRLDNNQHYYMRTANDGANAGSLSADGANRVVLYSQYNALRLESRGSHEMQFFTDATERMRLDSSGRLLLNKTNNNGSLIFQAQAPGGFSVGSGFYSGSTQSTIAFKDANTSGEYHVRLGSEGDGLVFFSNNTERMRIDSSGNLGVGTTLFNLDSFSSPALAIGNTTLGERGTIEIGANITTATAYGILAFTNHSSTDTTHNKRVAQISATRNAGNNNLGALEFATNDGASYVPRMIINYNGNVGIGNSLTNPVTKLYVHGTGDQTTSEVRAENTSTTQNGRGVVRVKSNTSTYGGAIFATNNDETAYGNNVFGLYTFDNQDLVIGTNNTRRMIIAANGYAGLGGITDPQHFLDINCGATAAPTYKGHIRLNSSSAVNSGHGGLEFVGSFFGSGYGVRLATVDEGSGMTPLTFNIRGNQTSWTEVMRITTTNGGRVGIKCTAPPNAFHVGSTMSIGSGDSQSITMRAYGSADTDITSLIGGSNFGGLVLGAAYGHYVIGLQENDDNDSFAVISGGGTTVGGTGTTFIDDNTFDYTCMRVLSKGIYNSPLGTSGRDVNINSAGILGYYSSLSAHKGNVTSLSDISWLYNLNPVSFNYKQQDNNANWLEELQEETSYGLIAEEVETINTDFVFYDGQDNLAGVDYKKFTAVLIKALQDHKSTIESLETRIAALEAN